MTSTYVVPVTQGQIVTHVVSSIWFAASSQVSNKEVQIPAQSSDNNRARGSTSSCRIILQSVIGVVASVGVRAQISV